MILPAKGQRTTEFYFAVVGLSLCVLGALKFWDAALFSGAGVIASYVASRGIAKAGFGRSVHEAPRNRGV